jgi:hypothetical protein
MRGLGLDFEAAEMPTAWAMSAAPSSDIGGTLRT